MLVNCHTKQMAKALCLRLIEKYETSCVGFVTGFESRAVAAYRVSRLQKDDKCIFATSVIEAGLDCKHIKSTYGWKIPRSINSDIQIMYRIRFDVSNRTCQYVRNININWPDDYYQSIKLIMQDNTDDINSNIQIQALNEVMLAYGSNLCPRSYLSFYCDDHVKLQPCQICNHCNGIIPNILPNINEIDEAIIKSKKEIFTDLLFQQNGILQKDEIIKKIGEQFFHLLLFKGIIGISINNIKEIVYTAGRGFDTDWYDEANKYFRFKQQRKAQNTTAGSACTCF